MQLLVIAAFVALYIHDSISRALLYEALPHPVGGSVLLALLAALLAVGWVVSVLAGRELDRGTNPEAFTWHDLAMTGLQCAACGAFYVAVLGLGWEDWVREGIGDWVFVDEFVTLLPLLMFAGLLWWIAYPVERRWHDALFSRWLLTGRPIFAAPTRRDFVISRIRNQVLFFGVPLACLMAWKEFCMMTLARLVGVTDAAGYPVRDAPLWKSFGLEAVQLAGVIVIFGVAPLVLVKIWDTLPLGPGHLRDRLMALCERNAVRVRELLVWRTHGTLANGAALGFFRPIRYILLSDQLLESLSLPQVEAVMAHEVAHVRKRHIPWLAVTVLGTVFLVGGLSSWYDRLTGGGMETDIRSIGAMTTASLGAVFLVFGAVSRRFEWQADAFAVRDLSRSLPAADAIGDGLVGSHASTVTAQAAAAMAGALGAVAELNGISPRRPSFRHGSIHVRQVRIRNLIGMPLDAFPIDRVCSGIKFAACVALILGVALTALDLFSTSSRPRADYNNQVLCPSPALNLSSVN